MPLFQGRCFSMFWNMTMALPGADLMEIVFLLGRHLAWGLGINKYFSSLSWSPFLSLACRVAFLKAEITAPLLESRISGQMTISRTRRKPVSSRNVSSLHRGQGWRSLLLLIPRYAGSCGVGTVLGVTATSYLVPLPRFTLLLGTVPYFPSVKPPSMVSVHRI